ncbi:MAG: PcfJ domain-containing protein [Deltaproteobacteria bacterium]|nr:PcfJ domain-containing protein [Deltaproteobacteria bacterium]
MSKHHVTIGKSYHVYGKMPGMSKYMPMDGERFTNKLIYAEVFYISDEDAKQDFLELLNDLNEQGKFEARETDFHSSVKPNPYRGGQPDLFEEGDTGEYVALEDMTDEEILALPKSAFNEDEWNSLEWAVQKRISKNEPPTPRDSISNVNNWDVSYGAVYSTHDWACDLYDNIYIEQSWLKEEIPGVIESDLDIAWENHVSSDAKDYLDSDGIRTLITSKKNYATYETESTQIGLELVADVIWTNIDSEVAEALGKKAPESEEGTIDKERAIYTFDDGAYVVKLTPGELYREGSKQKHCIGRPEQPYLGMVTKGEAAAYSLRDANGERVLTAFAELDDDGNPVRMKQIKGKANRKPGTDNMAGQIGKKGFRQAEVDHALEFLKYLDISPESIPDLEPALHYMKTGEKKTWDKYNPSSSCPGCGGNAVGFCARNPPDDDSGERPFDDMEDVILKQIDRKIDEGGGWAAIKGLPGGKDFVWDLIDQGILEEEGGYIRRANHSNPPRHFEASLTPKGLAMMKDIEKIAKGNFRYRGREADVAYETVLGRAKHGAKGLVR